MLIGTIGTEIQRSCSSRDVAPGGPGERHRGLTGTHILHSTWKQGYCAAFQRIK